MKNDASVTVEQPAPTESVVAPQPQVQYVMQEKSLKGVGGWLIFWIIVFGLNAISYIWWFFLVLIGLVEGKAEGVGLAVLIETITFSLLLTAASVMTVILIALGKKIGALLAYITLGLSALYVTIVSITAMTIQNSTCEYDSFSVYGHATRQCHETGQPAGVIIGLIGAIFVSWLSAFLIALYFKLSKRVKLTLIN